VDPSPRNHSTLSTPQVRAGGFGPLLFARFAHPPNSHGYCGPPGGSTLFESGNRGFVDADLIRAERSFHGAWTYLALIAEANGIDDPLDHRVVEAYWLGNQLLDRVDSILLSRALGQRLCTGVTVPPRARPHHSFHVFFVYPWVGLLGRKGGQPLRVLNGCRIRPGQVVSARGDEVTVRSRPLCWDGHRLGFGAVRVETVRAANGGRGFVTDLSPGDLVALHWDWVCDRLSRRQLHNLATYTERTLRMVNERVRRARPTAVPG